MTAKVWFAILGEIVVFGLLLFVPAGTVRWPAAWEFLGIFLAGTLVITAMLARRDPALLAERMKPLLQRGQPLWDKLLLGALAIAFVAWLPLMAIDARRFVWSHVPAWLQALGAAGVTAMFAMCYFVFRENAFLAPVVKLDADRGHRVIATGPYATVRHPMYAAALLFFVSAPLLLGSWWGLVGAVPLAGLLVARTSLEDRFLRRSLAGYAEYAARVRYRLVPGLW
jgi:protein-S-isoprenylcysteine O-methyltransferase Ste14